MQVGLSQARRLAQGKVIKIHSSSPFPVQIDGEPFILQPGYIELTHRGQVMTPFHVFVINFMFITMLESFQTEIQQEY